VNWKSLTENDVLSRLAKRIRLPAGSMVRTGVGDDCAVVRPRGSSEDLVFTTDLFVENVHFRRETFRPEDAGYRVLARGLSDIAAMGADPRFCLLSIAVAPWVSPRWLDRFYDGLLELSSQSGALLAGGDLGHASELACDIVVCGSTPRGKALMRSGARAGHAIYVSGALGGPAAGLRLGRGAAWKRHVRPQPRLALGRFLRGKASACMDLSDGLSLDLHRLCLASGLAAEIGKPPVDRSATLDEALHGGEDYELLFTVRTGVRIPAEFEGLRLTRIGETRLGKPGEVSLDGVPLERRGYDHLARRE
jgi:thiamine-monophosphate kinase